MTTSHNDQASMSGRYAVAGGARGAVVDQARGAVVVEARGAVVDQALRNLGLTDQEVRALTNADSSLPQPHDHHALRDGSWPRLV